MLFSHQRRPEYTTQKSRSQTDHFCPETIFAVVFSYDVSGCTTFPTLLYCFAPTPREVFAHLQNVLAQNRLCQRLLVPTDLTKLGFFTNSKWARSNQTVTVTSNGQQTEPVSSFKYLQANILEIEASATLPYKE